jgi:hypothetical protein
MKNVFVLALAMGLLGVGDGSLGVTVKVMTR